MVVAAKSKAQRHQRQFEGFEGVVMGQFRALFSEFRDFVMSRFRYVEVLESKVPFSIIIANVAHHVADALLFVAIER